MQPTYSWGAGRRLLFYNRALRPNGVAFLTGSGRGYGGLAKGRERGGLGLKKSRCAQGSGTGFCLIFLIFPLNPRAADNQPRC